MSYELGVLVPPLLGQLAQERVPRERQLALRKLYDLALESPEADWEQYLGQVLLVVMESLSERATCLPALQVRKQPAPSHDPRLGALLGCDG